MMAPYKKLSLLYSFHGLFVLSLSLDILRLGRDLDILRLGQGWFRNQSIICSALNIIGIVHASVKIVFVINRKCFGTRTL